MPMETGREGRHGLDEVVPIIRPLSVLKVNQAMLRCTITSNSHEHGHRPSNVTCGQQISQFCKVKYLPKLDPRHSALSYEARCACSEDTCLRNSNCLRGGNGYSVLDRKVDVQYDSGLKISRPKSTNIAHRLLSGMIVGFQLPLGLGL